MGHDAVCSGGCVGEDLTQISEIIVALRIHVGCAVHSLASDRDNMILLFTAT
jgi:hypothetical protein